MTALGLPEGRYPLPADKTSPLQHNTYFTSSTYPSGQSYLIAEKAGMDEISIKEFGTPSLTRIWLSSAPRISGAYAPGDSAAAGGARVDVLAVSPSAVSLRLTEENGSVTEKTFRGLDDSSVLDYLPSSAHDRAKWQLNSPDGKISVQLAMGSGPAGWYRTAGFSSTYTPTSMKSETRRNGLRIHASWPARTPEPPAES